MTHLDDRSPRYGSVHPPTATLPPADVPHPGSPPPRRRPLVALAWGAVALAAVIGVAAIIHGTGTSEDYQPVASVGAGPFTTPVGADQPGLTPIGGGTRPADSAQMYQQSPPQGPVCDAGSLLSQLQADPARAAAWAQVQRIAPGQLPIYLQSLIPVTLRADTAVVDHGYQTEPVPAVLAAGTSVLLNSYGQPVVKCYSGDPLTPGSSTDPAATTVVPAAAPIPVFTFSDPGSGRPVTHSGTSDTTGTGPAQSTGTGSAPLYASFAYNGSVLLSDGRVQKADGTVVTFPKRGPDTTGLPDGGWRDKNGLYYNQDGSRRDLLYIYGLDGDDFFLTPDGQVVDRNNRPSPLEPGESYGRNYDGSVTLYFADNGRTDTVTTSNSGVRGKEVRGLHVYHGYLTDDSNTPYNFDGTPRKDAKLPDGGVIRSDGSQTHPQQSGTPMVGPEHPVTPTTPPRNGGILPPRSVQIPAPPSVVTEHGPGQGTGGTTTGDSSSGTGSTSTTGGSGSSGGAGTGG
jgi:hypothetical protein